MGWLGSTEEPIRSLQNCKRQEDLIFWWVFWKYLKFWLITLCIYFINCLFTLLFTFSPRIRLSRILLGQSVGIQIKGRWYSMVNLLGCLCLVLCDWVLFGHFGRLGAILLVDKGNYNFLLFVILIPMYYFPNHMKKKESFNLG